jgi:predicted nucleic acid-binding protein
MSAEGAVYLDSSALVKLVVREAESAGLERYLGERVERISCALARVEVVRAVRSCGDGATRRARELLDRVGLLQLDLRLLDEASELGDGALRSLDAIHVAAARTLGEDLAAIVTYDRRMIDAARMLGLPVATPS